MLKPTREETVDKLKQIYQQNKGFAGGMSLIKAIAPKEANGPALINPDYKSLIQWKPKDYLNYFAILYKEQFNLDYKISFGSDQSIINQIGKFFKSIGMDYRFHTKSFIDWCFGNKDLVLRRCDYFTLLTIKEFINEYIQTVIIEVKQAPPEMEFDFVGDLNNLFDQKKMLLALRRYGIPITASYLHYQKNFTEKQIKDNILALQLETEDYIRIAKSSIIRSPYLCDMILCDWRDIFSNYRQFENENWWRDIDYAGHPHKSYGDLIK